MKITIRQEPDAFETEITVVCKKLDRELEEIISHISLIDNTVTGSRDGETYFIPLRNILYFEAVDNKLFFYTDDDVYESASRLYKLEEKFQNTSFVRISKSTIANLKKMTSIKPEKNSRLCATLLNGEKLIVSRQYIELIKERLGVK